MAACVPIFRKIHKILLLLLFAYYVCGNVLLRFTNVEGSKVAVFLLTSALVTDIAILPPFRISAPSNTTDLIIFQEKKNQ